MATIGTKVTMYDLAELSHNGQLLDMVKPLTEAQDLLKDAPMYEANDITSHRIVRNASLASATWRDLNEGLDASKGRETPIREVIGNIESRLEVDIGLLDYERDKEGFLARKEYAHMEGLGNDLGDALVTGSVAGGNHFDGIEARLNSLSATDGFGQLMAQTYVGSGSDLTSIIAVQWGPDQVHLVYPRGHKYLGIERDPRGVERVLDGDSKAYYAYVIRFGWKGGLVIADDRCVRRIANIESAGVTYNLMHSTYDVDPIIDALISMKNQGEGAVLYMNRTVYGQLWKVAKDKTNVIFDAKNPWGKPEFWFGNNRVRFTDSLVNTETAVS